MKYFSFLFDEDTFVRYNFDVEDIDFTQIRLLCDYFLVDDKIRDKFNFLLKVKYSSPVSNLSAFILTKKFIPHMPTEGIMSLEQFSIKNRLEFMIAYNKGDILSETKNYLKRRSCR